MQRMVFSISSDKAVWDAILSNKAVQNLQHSLVSAGFYMHIWEQMISLSILTFHFSGKIRVH